MTDRLFLTHYQNHSHMTKYITRSLVLSACCLLLSNTARPQTGLIQIINNCPDDQLDKMDIYINGVLRINDLNFRNATAFLEYEADEDLELGFAPRTSTGPDDILSTRSFNFVDHQQHLVIVNGIISSEGYDPAPALDIIVINAPRSTSAQPGNTDIVVVNGCTDCGSIDLSEVLGETLADDLEYEGVTDHNERPTLDRVLKLSDQAGNLLGNFDAPFATLGLQDSAITVLTSGFRNPMHNNDGPALGLWVALFSGGALIELGPPSSVGIGNAKEANISVWPNPATDLLHIDLGTGNATNIKATIIDAAGRQVLNIPHPELHNSTNSLRLDLKGVPQGAYVIRLSDATTERSIPFQVVR